MLNFNKENHTYKWNGKSRGGVTSVIGESCPFVAYNKEAADRAARFGSILHRTTELKDKGILDTYDKQLDPWLKAWEKFKLDYLPDLKGLLFVDIKSGAFTPKWYLQLAAYSKLVDPKTITKTVFEGQYYSEKYEYAGTIDRIYKGKPSRKVATLCVQLMGTGEYKAYTSKDTIETDFYTFLSMLNAWKWKKENKLLSKDVHNEYN